MPREQANKRKKKPPQDKLTRESLDSCLELIRSQYLSDSRPWVIGYSGGKDSTCVLQLVWNALAALEPGELTKPVYIITSDTLVEVPAVANHIKRSIERIKIAASNQKLPFEAHTVWPATERTFWVNLIGRGYPAPYNSFRWCTERMKIHPATDFINSRIAHYGEVIIVLGARRAESVTRTQVMQAERVVKKTVVEHGIARTYRKKVGRKEMSRALSRHKDIQSAYVFTPIEDWATQDVWTYLTSTPSPWSDNNRDLVTMYRNAQAGECPLVIDKSTPSCGGGRFGCWVCTVVDRDRSMEAMIDHGEDWLQPLLDIRDWLTATQEPACKPKIREYRRRSGRIEFFESNGKTKLRYGPYKFFFRQEILERLLQAQVEVRHTHPDVTLIQPDELHKIRQIWQQEEGDWEDSLPRIYKTATNESLEWLQDDWSGMGGAEKQILADECRRASILTGLLVELMDIEREFHGMSRRAGIFDRIDAALKKDWRTLEQAWEDQQKDVQLETSMMRSQDAD